jgi:hyperosmotically inducible periplasmic protein
MKFHRIAAVFITVAAVFAVPFARAQDTPASGDGAATSGMAPTSKKQMRSNNRMLSKAVRKSLTKTKGLVSADIVVLSRNGKVTLDGTVRDDSQIKLAADAAAATPGVKQVDNRITVAEPGN